VPPPVASTVSDRRRLGLTLLTLLLVAGAGAAFLRAQTLKLELSPLERPRVERIFSPVCGCASKARATLAFTVRRPLRVDAEIVGDGDRPVRVLVAGAHWPRGRRTLQWDGRDNAGRLVADGAYRLRIRLLERDREVLVPTSVSVDTTPPRARLLSVEPRTLPRPRRGRPSPRPIEVRYRASESGRPALLVDGRTATRRNRRPSGRSVIVWGGHARGRPVRPGAHRIAVQIRDRAGNLGPPTHGVRVRVRR
jgi:hypothetical protein